MGAVVSATVGSELVIEALTEYAVTRRAEPFTLASGATSHHYVDVKAALCRPAVLRAVSVSLASGAQWFSVRKEPKRRGHSRTVEGAVLGPGARVLLVDDVVSTGASTIKALEAVEAAGATPVAAIPVVDRAGLAARGVRYVPLVHAHQLGIPDLRS